MSHNGLLYWEVVERLFTCVRFVNFHILEGLISVCYANACLDMKIGLHGLGCHLDLYNSSDSLTCTCWIYVLCRKI